MSDWCCLSPRAAQGAEEAAEAEARKTLSVKQLSDQRTQSRPPTPTGPEHTSTGPSINANQSTQRLDISASDLTSGMLPINTSPAVLAELEHAAHVRSLQKSPRRLSPARRLSKASSDPAPTLLGSHTSGSTSVASPSLPLVTASKVSRKSSAAIDDSAVKIILLGSGESGKSTFSKQMKVIHSGGFTEEEILSYRPEVLRNVLEAMQQVIQGIRKLEISFGGEQALISKVKKECS